QGQHQLIMMAQALLRRSSIIVFDMDAKIQAMIQEEFNNLLLLTVVHRLNTVIHYDHLIVLVKGEVSVDVDKA
ncbi:hypothetical protein PAXRUDRAFT_145818, partial [Paxillus rubicundulus Ve08.2h10]